MICVIFIFDYYSCLCFDYDIGFGTLAVMNIPSIYWVVGLLVLGATLFGFLKKPMGKLFSLFKERAPLVKKYWQLVIPLVIVTAIAYVLVYFYANNEIAFDLVGQTSGLALGIIAGYIAFSELGENRFEKLQDTGMDEFRALRFKSAQLKLEEAHRIKPKDVSVLANLMELYVIIGLYEKFDNKVVHYRRVAIEEAEELTLLYLIAFKEAVRDRPKDAKAKIKDITTYVSNHPHARDTLGWGDGEFVESEVYKLLSSESRQLAKNCLNYVTNKLSSDDEIRFAEGNYLLKPKPSLTK